MLRARPSHTPWHAHTNIRRRVDIMTDLCPTQPFPNRLLLLVLVDTMLFLVNPLSTPSIILQQNCVFYAYLLVPLFEESQKLSVLNGYNIWKQTCGFEWKCTFFFLYVKYMPCLQVFYGIIYGMSTPWLWAVLCHHTYDRCRTKFVKVEWVPPFSHPPVWKWSGGFCSVVKDCVCSVFRYVGWV
jgi:hypothetical protein